VAAAGGQCRKRGRQARFKAWQIGLRAGRQIEVADEAAVAALPEFQRDQLVCPAFLAGLKVARDSDMKSPNSGGQNQRSVFHRISRRMPVQTPSIYSSKGSARRTVGLVRYPAD
jgi:hypothetical protein